MNLLRRLWADDRGAIISVEFILIVAILIFGLIPGLVALRNSVDAALGTIGNILTVIVPNFTFSGFAIGGVGGPAIAQVGGVTFTPSTNIVLTSSQIAPVNYTGGFVQVDPAP